VPTFLAAPTFPRDGVAGGFILDEGAGLVPSISLGVLFAQGTMYRPSPQPSEYNVTGASWTNTQYAVTTAQWFPGNTVALPAALIELLGLPEGTTNLQLPAIIYTIGSHSIQVGQVVSVGGIVQAGVGGDNLGGYNATGIVVSVS